MAHPSFKICQPPFTELIGDSPKLELLFEDDSHPFAHEAGVFLESKDELYFTSNQYSGKDGKPRVQISRLKIARNGGKHIRESIHAENVPMANGGHLYKDGIIFCAQGNFDTPGGIAYMDLMNPSRSHLIVCSFYGRPFNSVNDLIVHRDGSIWFTDPAYGFEQGFRPEPSLPNQVYRYEPATKNIRAMADGFGKPNGLCLSPDQTILYVTDTDSKHGTGGTDLTRASTIYAFDVQTYSNQPFLCNRRLFAMADNGIPDGIKCDKEGNVYSGCGDGIHIWSPGGILLGKILLTGGASNFCFGRDGELFLLNEHRIWWARINPRTGSCVGDNRLTALRRTNRLANM